MTYSYREQAGNVHLIDTNMFGFDKFQSSFLIIAEEVTLIDCGVPTSFEILRDAIKKHGITLQDISHIFVTHCEHPDHSGNAGAILLENRKAKVHIHPIGLEYLTHPEIEADKRSALLPPEMAERFGDMVPVPEDRITLLKDGERIDLGGGHVLRAIFTPGHQPGGIVLYDEKDQGLFVNDLLGMYLADADFSMIFTPNRAEVKKYIESLNMIKELPLKSLFLGHFGISDKPAEVIDRALGLMTGLMNICYKCTEMGKPEDIAPMFRDFFKPELEKLKKNREEKLYLYLKDELIASCSEAFSRYCQELKL
jgi:glyoxylase-like metal-dependent hydrolase (beta-lactamase superfamily II)